MRVLKFGNYRIVDRGEGDGLVIERRGEDALGRKKWDEVDTHVARRGADVMALPSELVLRLVRRIEQEGEQAGGEPEPEVEPQPRPPARAMRAAAGAKHVSSALETRVTIPSRVVGNTRV